MLHRLVGTLRALARRRSATFGHTHGYTWLAVFVLSCSLVAGTVALSSGSPSRHPRLPDPNFARPQRTSTGNDASSADVSPADRAASRTKFRDQSDAEAQATARQHFRGLLDTPPLVWPPRHADQDVHGYLSSHAAVVSDSSGHGGVVESSLPLFGKSPSGDREPIDLTLIDEGAALVPRSAAAAVRIPKRSEDQLRFTDQGFGVRLGDADPQTADVSSNKAFFANVVRDGDLVLEPQAQGAELSVVLRSPAAPTSLPLAFDLESGQRLHAAGPSVEVLGGDRRIAVVGPAAATDANGATVPVSYRVDGDRVVMDVDTSGDLTYPILVDPPIGVYDDNGTSVGSSSFGWWWPDWSFATYSSDSYSACNSGQNTLFFFCQGNSNGGYTTGGALFVRAHPFWSFTANDWGEWLKQAPADAYIYGYDTTAVSHQANKSKLFAGAWSWTEGWERGRVLLPGGTVLVQGVTYYEDTDSSVPATLYYRVHNGWTTDASDPIPTGNYVAFGMRMTGGAPGTSFPQVAMGGGATYESEQFAPTLDAPGHTTAPPSGWVDNYSDSVSDTAHDRGLGMGTVAASGPGLSASASACTQNGAPPNTSNLHASGYYDTCQLNLALPTTAYTAPEGVNAYSVTATDLVGNRDTAQDKSWQVKVDRSPPDTLNLSGDLYDDRNTTDSEGNPAGAYISSDETLQVDAADGSATAPRSGVSDLEMRVDGQRVHPEDLYHQASCTSSGCPSAASHQFTFHANDFAEGDHTVTVVARDLMANPSNVTGGPHTTVRTFTVFVGHDPEGDAAEYDAPYTPPPPDVDPNAPASAPPAYPEYLDALTSANIQLAQADVQRDAISPLADLNHVLGLASYTITDIGPLTQGENPVTGKKVNIGATMVLQLSAPTGTVDTTVPSYREPWPGTNEYVPFRSHMVATGLTDLFVDVDLRNNQIIDIEPGPSSEASTYDPVAGTPLLPPLRVED